MNLQALTAAAVRFFALYLVLGSIDTAAELAMTAALPKEISGGGLLSALAIQLVVSLVAAGFLLARTHVVTGWILRGQASGQEEVAVTAGVLATLAFSLAGLIFLVSGLETLLNQIADWLFSSYLGQHPVARGLGRERMARMVSSAVQVIAGIWLLFQTRKSRKVSGAAGEGR
jgi:hypothetical protein